MYILTNYNVFYKSDVEQTDDIKEAKKFTEEEVIERYDYNNPYWDFVRVEDFDKVKEIHNKIKELKLQKSIVNELESEIRQLRSNIRKNEYEDIYV